MISSVKQNLSEIELKIAEAARKSGRDAKDITVIAVTKYASCERAEEAVQAGVVNLGESYEKGFLEKKEQLGDKVSWHFIGSLQSKKVKNVINKIDYLHSLDRMSLAEEIQKRAEQTVKCLVQVNVSGEVSKHGVDASNLNKFLQNLKEYDKIKIIGLMTMAPLTENESEIRKCFSELNRLQGEIKSLNLPNVTCEHLSMGMSNDYQIAIEEGATMIRIGTALVGE